jgi:hypothetical protein
MAVSFISLFLRTTMADYLVKQAIQNVWCTPEQDQQSIFKLGKITRYGGVYTKVDVMWRQYALPVAGVLFHCYQIGNISPRHLGWTRPPLPGQWMRIPEVCELEETVVDLYTVSGRQSPRMLAWYTVTEDHNLILAVQKHERVAINYDTEALYLRVYHNAYYSSVRRNANHDFIEVRGAIPANTNEILAIQNSYDTARQRGVAYAFINGYLVDHLDLLTVTPGDVVEYVYDGSIYVVEDLVIGNLPVFDSTLDAKRKYLVHATQALKDNITYHDDVDVFLLKKNPQGRFNGLYFHRNQRDAVRQVTHVDFSVAIPYLDSFINTLEGWTDLNDLTIRLHMRHSGYRRPLVHEANRIKELYKLPDTEIINAMAGIDAVVPEWTAAHLEASAYTKIMRSNTMEITPALVQSAFGYNAMSQLLAPTPQFVKNVSQLGLVDIPPNLQYRSTIFEYDVEGHLLGWYNHALGGLWTTRNENTRMVQILAGYGIKRLDERYGQQAATIDANLDYRMYNCTIVNGQPDNIWRDVTGTGLYAIAGITLNWLTSSSTTYTMVRSNLDFLCYDLALPIQGGVLAFSLSSEQDRGAGPRNTIMQVQMGELDVWMNQKALVEGIDYIVNFPRVVIINKKYIDHTQANQKITVRFCGHAKEDLSRAVVGDRGFVSHGVLSNNNKFDIRDDKVLHIAVNGGVYDRSELTFAEEHSGVNVLGVPNGSPYVVRDIVVPMRGTTNAKTYELRDQALVTDQRVTDYLTMKLPAPTYTELSPIKERYPVYSPFVSALIDDLHSKKFADPRMFEHYDSNVLRDMCRSYESLLEFDPTRGANKADSHYVSVQAYYKDVVTNLGLFEYRFLSRAVSLYLNNAVELSHYVTVTA